MENVWFSLSIYKGKSSLKVTLKITDSFTYTIKTEDFYKDIRNDLEAKFDTSDYSAERTNLYNFKINKKILIIKITRKG